MEKKGINKVLKKWKKDSTVYNDIYDPLRICFDESN